MTKEAVKTAFYPLYGGLDLVTPPIATPQGRAVAGVNYEADIRGYLRFVGMERYDGRPEPHDQGYWMLTFSTGTAAITAGQTVTGATSGATGIALYAATVETGSYGGGNAAGYLILTQVAGTFATFENLQVSAVTKSVAAGLAVASGADNDTDDATYEQAAIEYARTNILAPDGGGAVRGIFVYEGDVYCFRDDGAATQGTLFKATTAGWVAQSLGRTLQFDAAVGQIFEGNTVTGASSGASGVVKRVTLESGTWAAAGTGRLTFASVTGAFTNNENLQVAAATKAVANLTLTSNVLAPGGRYETVITNFYGQADTTRAYCANGVGRAFDWDGSVGAFIYTGMTADTPAHVANFKNQLFLTFAGGSLQNSSIGEPHTWTVLTGATEMGLGEEITALLADVQGAMVIYGRNLVSILYGNDKDDFSLTPLNNAAGAIAWTVQLMAQPMHVDNIGVRTLQATQAYGNFNMGAVTDLITPVFRQKREAGITPVASMRVRSRNIYRVFFDDGTAVSVYMGREKPECMMLDLGRAITCACSGDDEDGNEVLFVGDEDGFVYRLDVGTSMDGEEVDAFVRLAFNNVGTPQQNKRWVKAALEIDADPNTEIGLTTEYAYGDPDQVAGALVDLTVSGSGGFWEEAFWDEFYWSSPVNGIAETAIDGFGRNVSVTVTSNETYRAPHVLTGMTLFFSYRGLAR